MGIIIFTHIANIQSTDKLLNVKIQWDNTQSPLNFHIKELVCHLIMPFTSMKMVVYLVHKQYHARADQHPIPVKMVNLTHMQYVKLQLSCKFGEPA